MTTWKHAIGSLAGLAATLGVTSAAFAQQPLPIVDAEAARRFAVLPVEVGAPEGIVVDPERGAVFVGTLNLGGSNFLLRLDLRGRIEAVLDMGTTPLLGLALGPRDGQVYFASAGALVGGSSSIRRVPGDFGPSTTVEDVAILPLLDPPPGRSEANADGSMDTITFGRNAPLPNGLVFREDDGSLLFTDSFQAAVFQIADPSSPSNVCPTGSDCIDLVAQDGLLSAIGVPQFGVNGIAISPVDASLLVTNTGDDRLLRIDPATGAVSVLVEGLNGADGLIRGPGNTVILTANQSDEVVILDAATGAPLAELGEFLGFRRDGTPRGLSVPASLTLLGNTILVTNLSFGRAPNADGSPTPFSISSIRIPRALRD